MRNKTFCCASHALQIKELPIKCHSQKRVYMIFISHGVGCFSSHFQPYRYIHTYVSVLSRRSRAVQFVGTQNIGNSNCHPDGECKNV